MSGQKFFGSTVSASGMVSLFMPHRPTAPTRAAVQNENGTCNPQVPFAKTH